MNFRTDELHLQLPSPEMQDSSLNILRFAALGTSLIITRSLLGDGQTLADNFNDQLRKLQTQVQDLRFDAPVEVRVGAAQVPALEIRSQFSKGPEQVFQYQLALILPGTRRLLALSYVKPAPLAEAEAAHWAQIKHSLEFATGNV